MNLEEVLENAKEREISREEALYLFRETTTYDKTLRLFQIASEVRDREVGRIIKIIGTIGSITPCTLNPPCNYCSRSSKSFKNKSYNKESVLTLEEISVGAKLIEETGTKFVGLSGGTIIGSEGKKIVEAVKAIKSASKLDVYHINFGPSFSEETLIELKRWGVKDVGISFETTNKRLFKEVRPGISFEREKKFAEIVDSIGLGLYVVLMAGLGGSYCYEDYVDQMFYLKKFENLNCLAVARFNPFPGTPLENHPPASPLETARTAAIARLIFRDIEIRIPTMFGDYIYLSFSILAGASRAHAGACIYKVGEVQRSPWFGVETKKIDNMVFFNPLPISTKFVKEAGMAVE